MSEFIKIIEEYFSTAFRVQFYPNDKACDVKPWKDPLVPTGERARNRRTHRRKAFPEVRTFVRKEVNRCIEAGF